MPVIRSAGPFFLRDGAAWCGRCRRTRLARVTGSSRYECSLCDRGETDVPADPDVTLLDGMLMCGRCGTNALMPTGPDRALECPGCDLPPWERAKLTQGVHVQETLGGDIARLAAEPRRETPTRPAKPLPIVRGCFYCHQTTEHEWVWQFSRWRAVCTACGNRLSVSRAKGVRANKRRGQR